MSEKNKDVKLNEKRTTFSKGLKRKILIEITKGVKPEDALLKYAFDSLGDITKDKKYASKLIHKWRKEIYEHKEFLYLINHELDDEALDYEIENLSNEDDDDDEIMRRALEIYAQSLEEAKKKRKKPKEKK